MGRPKKGKLTLKESIKRHKKPAPKSGLAKSEPLSITPNAAATFMFAGLRDELAKDLPAAELLKLKDAFQKWGELFKTFETAFKKRMTDFALKNGEEIGEVGSRKVEAEGLAYEIQPHGGGYDDKKVEAMLRTKGIDVSEYMDTDVTYKASARLDALLVPQTDENGETIESPVTPDELAACMKQRGWSLKKVHPAGNIEPSIEALEGQNDE